LGVGYVAPTYNASTGAMTAGSGTEATAGQLYYLRR